MYAIIYIELNCKEEKMFTKLQEILAKQLNISKENIKPESRLLEDLNADSLDFVELLMTVEDEFDVVITDEDAKTLKTIDDVCKFIEAHIEK